MRSTYTIAADGKAITCHRCGMTSHHPEDVALHYCAECHRFHDDVQTIDFYVIYERPRDYPDDYVLRKQATVLVPGQPAFEVIDKACIVGPLAEVKAHVPKGCTRVGPLPGDDPVILEVWMR